MRNLYRDREGICVYFAFEKGEIFMETIKENLNLESLFNYKGNEVASLYNGQLRTFIERDSCVLSVKRMVVWMHMSVTRIEIFRFRH